MKLIKDLALALLNATLLLLALCLFLAWQVSGTAQDVAASFAASIKPLEPVATEIHGVTQELAALRADLQTLRDGSDPKAAETAARIQGKIDAMQARLTEFDARMKEVKQAPQRLIDAAITRAAIRAGETLQAVRGCSKPQV